MKKMVQKQLEARSNKSDTLKSEHFKFALNHVKGKTLDIGCGYGWVVVLNPKDFYGIEVDSECVKSHKEDILDLSNKTIIITIVREKSAGRFIYEPSYNNGDKV